MLTLSTSAVTGLRALVYQVTKSMLDQSDFDDGLSVLI